MDSVTHHCCGVVVGVRSWCWCGCHAAEAGGRLCWSAGAGGLSSAASTRHHRHTAHTAMQPSTSPAQPSQPMQQLLCRRRGAECSHYSQCGAGTVLVSCVAWLLDAGTTTATLATLATLTSHGHGKGEIELISRYSLPCSVHL